MLVLSQRQPSYFDGMDRGDLLGIIDRNRLKVVFKKIGEETGEIEVTMDKNESRKFEIEYDFENFPTMKEEFAKRIRYLFLRDFSIPEYQNEDLKNTKLNLVNNLNLGHGIYMKNIRLGEVVSITKEIKKLRGENADEVPESPEQLLPEGVLSDFIYSMYMKDGEKDIPLGVVSIPFMMADDIYDLNSLSDIREFFTDMLEDNLGAPIGHMAKELSEKHGMKEVAGAFERVNSGTLTGEDVLDFYNERMGDIDPDSEEANTFKKHIQELIRRLKNGEDLTMEDLKYSYIRPATPKSTEYIKDYRGEAQMAKLNRDIARLEVELENVVKTMDDREKAMEIRTFMFELSHQISELKLSLEAESDKSEREKIISKVYDLLQNAKDFIKK